MNKDMKKSNDNININEKDNMQEDYTFVRETIRKKPPAFIRVLKKAAKSPIVWIIAVCICLLLLFILKPDSAPVAENEDGEEAAESETTAYSEQESLKLDESIGASLAEVVVVYYSSEEETSSDETSVMYQDEELTADISADKEIQTTVLQEETNTQEATEAESTEEETQTEQSRHIEEEKYYTGLIVASVGDVFICIEYDKVSTGGDILVSFGDGNYAKADIYGSDTINGLAVLRVYSDDIDAQTKQGLKAASVRSADEINVGDALIYVGNPYGEERLTYTGTLEKTDSGHCNYDTFYRGIITDIDIGDVYDGFVFDENGDAVAMVGEFEELEVLQTNIAGISIDDVMFIINAIVDGSPIRHIGIKGETVTDTMREITGENMPDGMYVTDVARDSTAYKAGIMVGDIVISAGENTVTSLKDIQNILAKSTVNADITLVVNRKIGTGYSEFTIKVPVEAY